MAIPTVTITTSIFYPNGQPAKGLEIVATLKGTSQNIDSYIVPRVVTAFVDEFGDVVLSLWPNTDGLVESYYEIVGISSELGKLLHVVVSVPTSAIPLELEDIALPVCGNSIGSSSGSVSSIRRINTAEGIAGGGDLTTNRTHTLDLTTITTEAPAPTGEFIVAVQDPNLPGQVRWSSLNKLPGVGFDQIESSFASFGQTVIPISAPFLINTNALDVYIRGVYQAPNHYVESIGFITLSEAMELGDEISIKIKKSLSFGLSIAASNVSYGLSTVQAALDLLFAGSPGLTPPQLITSGSHSASTGDRLFVDTTSGPVTIILPVSPLLGFTVQIVDITSAAGIIPVNDLINMITVNRSGEKINGVADDLLIDQAGIGIELIYIDSTHGWRILE
jgi:hypothetical protein